MMPMQGMSGSPYAALLAMMQNGQGAQGFGQPGGGAPPFTTMPQLQPFQGGGAGAPPGAMPPPSMPAGATAQPGGAPQGGGMFGSMMQNPMVMQMLAKQMQGGQPGAMPNYGQPGGMSQMPATLPSTSSMPQQSWIQQLLARFGGQGGQ